MTDSPNSTRRLIASAREGESSCLRRQLSPACKKVLAEREAPKGPERDACIAQKHTELKEEQQRVIEANPATARATSSDDARGAPLADTRVLRFSIQAGRREHWLYAVSRAPARPESGDKG